MTWHRPLHLRGKPEPKADCTYPVVGWTLGTLLVVLFLGWLSAAIWLVFFVLR